MHLFTPYLHNPASPRGAMPPPCMWKDMCDRLDQLAAVTAHKPRLHVHGTVNLAGGGAACSLHVVVGGELVDVQDITNQGRFRLDLSADEHIRLILVSTGHFPRVVEIRPARTVSGPVNHLDLCVVLTPNGLVDGKRAAPLREKLIPGRDGAPDVIGYDRTPNSRPNSTPLPLLKRAS